MKLTEEEYLAHYGTPRHSGRYPWGSGGHHESHPRNPSFLDTVEKLRKEGMSDAEIAKAHGMSRDTLQNLASLHRNERRQQLIDQVTRMSDKGMSNVAIARQLGMPEATVRSLKAPSAAQSATVLKSTTDMLRREVEAKGAIDIGTDVHRSISLNDNPSAQIGVSSTKFKTAVTALQQEGYKVHYVKVRQLGTGKDTTVKVLAKSDVQWKDLKNDPSLIKPITEHTPDHGESFNGFQEPIHVSSKRVKVVYGNEGGTEKDGLIYVRRNVPDLSMGRSNYAQVRISVDGTHYLKGMAIYGDDHEIPHGADLVFHTNKLNTGNKHDAMKAQEKDPDFPFGAVVSQLKDPTGKKVISALNKVNDEGKWDTWNKSLPSQFLSKQSPKLAKTQLDRTYDGRRREYERIMALTNPEVRRKLLDSFANETDAAAVHLKAAALPNQATKVLIPLASLKPHEVFAPSFPDGTPLALVRFPHGGTFEIPQVTVNNKNREGRRLLGTSNPDVRHDAIGIHHEVAARLSGADFDGDTVLAIPNRRGEVRSTAPLDGLKGFDPKRAYPPYNGMRTIDGGRWDAKEGKVVYPKTPDGHDKVNRRTMQQKMGDVSNLITDMTIKGANTDELARAVRHSMVVIDAEKHHLDYKSSAEANGILALKKRYQTKPDGSPGGAATIISRAKSPIRIPERRLRRASEGGPIDPKTGKLVYVPTGATYTKNGKVIEKTTETTRLGYAEDAHDLVSKPVEIPIEHIYADHSNRLKALANEARKSLVTTPTAKQYPPARKLYAAEVESLKAKLNVARKNAPRERQAQAVANARVAQKRAANPHLDTADLKKIEAQALAEARVRTGAHKTRIDLTPREWLAIQSGAISATMLRDVLKEGKIDQIREFATPRAHEHMSAKSIERARAMLDRGYTQAEVASHLGVKLSTLKNSLQQGGE